MGVQAEGTQAQGLAFRPSPGLVSWEALVAGRAGGPHMGLGSYSQGSGKPLDSVWREKDRPELAVERI